MDQIMNKSSLLQFTLEIIIFLFLSYATTYAETGICPETKIPIQNDFGEYGCKYTWEIQLDRTTWYISNCDHFLKTAPEGNIEFDKKSKVIYIYSKTHPIMARVHLSKEEFKKKNRDYWVEIGRKYLTNLEQKNQSCFDNSFNNPFNKETISNDLKTKEQPVTNRISTSIPSRSDDWGSPAPKAKMK